VTSGLVGLVVAAVVELLASDVVDVTAVVVLKEDSADISELLWFVSGLFVPKHRQARQMRHRVVKMRVLVTLSTYYLNRGLLMLSRFLVLSLNTSLYLVFACWFVFLFSYINVAWLFGFVVKYVSISCFCVLVCFLFSYINVAWLFGFVVKYVSVYCFCVLVCFFVFLNQKYLLENIYPNTEKYLNNQSNKITRLMRVWGHQTTHNVISHRKLDRKLFIPFAGYPKGMMGN